MRNFVGIDLGRERAPDETTVCKFRHLLERHSLGKQMLALVNGYLARHGLKIGTGTIVDATILAEPPSTKNKDKKRDPEMHQAKKRNQWHFGMKAHVGVDADTKLIHSAEATAANVAVNGRQFVVIACGGDRDPTTPERAHLCGFCASPVAYLKNIQIENLPVDTTRVSAIFFHFSEIVSLIFYAPCVPRL